MFTLYSVLTLCIELTIYSTLLTLHCELQKDVIDSMVYLLLGGKCLKAYETTILVLLLPHFHLSSVEWVVIVELTPHCLLAFHEADSAGFALGSGDTLPLFETEKTRFVSKHLLESTCGCQFGMGGHLS